MKKIMFNDRYGLTEAVLSGRKTQTRRICAKDTPLGNWSETYERAKYRVGEVVAVAQCYCDFYDDVNDPRIFPSGAGWTNKMFVRADLMPHQIRITNVRVERLQDISYEDCLAEGVVEIKHRIPTQAPQFITQYYPCQYLKDCADKVGWGRVYNTPQKAYAALIDKISDKGTWNSNPYVFVYDFELVK